MKVRIFALAKELDLDSKDLIQHCNDAGIPVKNSALASITPSERDVLLDYLKTMKTSGKPSPAPAVPVPVRETPLDVGGKVRKIRTLGPLGKALRRGKDDEDAGLAAPSATEFEADVESELAAEVSELEAEQSVETSVAERASVEAEAVEEAVAPQAAEAAEPAAQLRDDEEEEGGLPAVRGFPEKTTLRRAG